MMAALGISSTFGGATMTVGHMRTLSVLVIVLFSFGCGKDERQAIQTAWDDYQSAILAKDGQKAVVLINQASIDYYGRLKKLIIEAGPDEIRDLPFIDKAGIASVRASMDLRYLQQLTPEQFFMYGVQQGQFGDQSMQTVTIEDIEVDGDHASAAFVGKGVKGPFRYEFTKEGGFWKHDLTALMNGAGDALKNAMRRPGAANMDLDQMLLMGVSMKTGKNVGPEIWEKPKLK
jgi:hypothetical protein